jgi:uroporphyrinogen-III decarboxylase
MTGKERIQTVLSHREADKIALDFGGTTVTGIHVKTIEGLRRHYGLEARPIKVTEPFQMLGEIDEELIRLWEVDTVGVSGERDMFGHRQEDFVETRMPWGQVVLLPRGFHTRQSGGNLYVFPQGDTACPPTAVMPEGGYFFDAIERVPSTDIGEETRLEDNLEEFTRMSDEDVSYWANALSRARASGRAVIANIGGTALGDIALVPAMNLKNPKGIRAIADWYMSTVVRADMLHELFERQTDIAIENLERINRAAGDCIDAVYICGTDFGTQDSQFCSAETLNDLYGEGYRKVNGWVHRNTAWKTFKHCCGAIVPLLDTFIDLGFDIINPVQINAAGMDPQYLKDTFGSRITFWGGGIDTQKALQLGTPEQVKEQVKRLCGIFGDNGGFVFNSIHNIQANVPLQNVIALMDTVCEIRRT